MNFPISDFMSVPNAETIQMILIVCLIVGLCFAGIGLICLPINKRKGEEKI